MSSVEVSSLSELCWERTGVYIVGECTGKGRRGIRPLSVNSEDELSNCRDAFVRGKLGLY